MRWRSAPSLVPRRLPIPPSDATRRARAGARACARACARAVAARLTRVWGTAAVDVRGDEPPERIDELHRLVSQRCPIANMFAAAGVDMDGVVWAARES